MDWRDVAPSGVAVVAAVARGRVVVLFQQTALAFPSVRDGVQQENRVATILGGMNGVDVVLRVEAGQLNHVEVELVGVK